MHTVVCPVLQRQKTNQGCGLILLLLKNTKMWKTQLNRAVRELRFVVKQAPEHHGAWRFIETKMPELRVLNQNTFFATAEISEEFTTPSAIFFVYGDAKDTQEPVLTAGLSCEDIEKIIKEKVSYGLTLPRHSIDNNDDRDLPVDIVESHNYVKHMDETF